MDEAIEEENINIDINELTDHETFGNELAPKEKPEPYKKKFVERNSLLTDLYENKHIRAIYNFFAAITVFLILINVLYEWRDHQIISFGFVALAEKFYKIEIAILAWLLIMGITFLTFPVYNMWSKNYRSKKFKILTSTFCIFLYCVYSIGMHIITVWVCLQFDLSPITRLALLLETLRIGMKSYAFIRTNAGRVTTQTKFKTPTFGHFIYFMFSPTMLYRDEYPRTINRSWKRVFQHFVEFLVAVYSLSLANKNFLQKSFLDYGKSQVTLFSVIIWWFEIIFIVPVLFYGYNFYLLQHSWLNMFAELMRFGDRTFYKDWWTSKSMAEHYRRWNALVHEWLYEYMYSDLYYHVSRKSFAISSFTTILISAVIHEYVLAISLEFFVPVVSLIYISVGVLLMYIDLGKWAGNIFFWFSLIIGISLLTLLYLMEYYARINCPGDRSVNTTLSYYYTPMFYNNILI